MIASPAGHVRQNALEVSIAYFPFVQGVHVANDEAPSTSDADPEGQAKQTSDEFAAVTLEYLPLEHGRQTDAPSPPYLPPGHGLHVAIDDAPSVLECIPAAQGKQVEEELAPWVLE